MNNRLSHNAWWFGGLSILFVIGLINIWHFGHAYFTSEHSIAQQQYGTLLHAPLGTSRTEFLQTVGIAVEETERVGQCDALSLHVDGEYYGDYSTGVTIYIDRRSDKVVGKIFADGSDGHAFLPEYKSCRSKS